MVDVPAFWHGKMGSIPKQVKLTQATIKVQVAAMSSTNSLHLIGTKTSMIKKLEKVLNLVFQLNTQKYKFVLL